uniref:Uncharacterized protein AlNc14C18G1849 n=1 Tax=Albugo laibachii Nc14 TaxID=890382 RepID=F0W4M8_9STRA|nr:conserved hypothetical protein [Albugo laibachii Nc14]|eukprot:CCA16062.1 conserved hypothetical protein [Albugo laibachii Nc14]
MYLSQYHILFMIQICREDSFIERLPCVLVTGRGFPDLSTRIFVRNLSDILQIPVLGLCDCNPFGLSIMVSFRKIFIR